MVSQPLWKFWSIKVLPIPHCKELTSSQKLKTMPRASTRLRHKLGYGKNPSDFQLLKSVDPWEVSTEYADSSLLTTHFSAWAFNSRMKEHTMKTIVLDHGLSFCFRQGSTVTWTRISQTYHGFEGASLNCNVYSLFFPHQNTTEHAFTAESSISPCSSPFQPQRSFMTFHCSMRKFTEKQNEHMSPINPHRTIMTGKVYHLAPCLDEVPAWR